MHRSVHSGLSRGDAEVEEGLHGKVANDSCQTRTPKNPASGNGAAPPPPGSAVRLRDMSANTVHRCACVQPSVGTSCLQLVCVSGGSKPRVSCAHYPPPRGALLPSRAGYVRSPSTPPTPSTNFQTNNHTTSEPHTHVMSNENKFPLEKSRGRLPGFTDERDPWKPHSERGWGIIQEQSVVPAVRPVFYRPGRAECFKLAAPSRNVSNPGQQSAFRAFLKDFLDPRLLLASIPPSSCV